MNPIAPSAQSQYHTGDRTGQYDDGGGSVRPTGRISPQPSTQGEREPIDDKQFKDLRE